MRYRDLKEMTFKDWDGRPFRAIYVQLDEEEIYDTDVERLNGIMEGCLILGYINGCWRDENELSWNHVYPIEWNKKPKKRMTNRQLAKWLAKGNGERSSDKLANSYHQHDYPKSEANDFVDECILVRKWDSEKWVEPTVDLLED